MLNSIVSDKKTLSVMQAARMKLVVDGRRFVVECWYASVSSTVIGSFTANICAATLVDVYIAR